MLMMLMLLVLVFLLLLRHLCLIMFPNLLLFLLGSVLKVSSSNFFVVTHCGLINTGSAGEEEGSYILGLALGSKFKAPVTCGAETQY